MLTSNPNIFLVTVEVSDIIYITINLISMSKCVFEF